MKTTRSLLLVAALTSAGVLLPGCSKPDPIEPAGHNAKAAVTNLPAEFKATTVDSWDSVKDYSYDKRDDLVATLHRMADRHDAEIEQASAQLTGLSADAAKARDLAVKEFHAAHARLKGQLADLRSGSSDSWIASKAKVEQSWLRLQAAYEKARASAAS